MSKLYRNMLYCCLVICCIFMFAACNGEAKLISISVSQMPAKTTYYSGDIFDKGGMKITANYSDGSTKEVEDYTVDKTVLDIGDNAVVVSFREKTTVINITVVKSDREAPLQIEYWFESDALVIDVQNGVEYNFDNRGWSACNRYEDLVEGKTYNLSARYYATLVSNASAVNTVAVTLNKQFDDLSYDYGYFRNKYASLSNEIDINLRTASYGEIMNMLSTRGRYLIYFGGAWDSRTQQHIKDLNDAATQFGVIVRNFDVRLDGGEIMNDENYLNSGLPNAMREQLLQKLNNSEEAGGCSFVKYINSVTFSTIPEAELFAVEIDEMGYIKILARGIDKLGFASVMNAFLS